MCCRARHREGPLRVVRGRPQMTRGEDGSVDRPDPADATTRLRVLLAGIDRGEVDASDVQRAYLAGAVDTLDQVSGTRSEQGCDQHPELVSRSAPSAPSARSATSVSPPASKSSPAPVLTAQRATLEAEAQRRGWTLERSSPTPGSQERTCAAPPSPTRSTGATEGRRRAGVREARPGVPVGRRLRPVTRTRQRPRLAPRAARPRRGHTGLRPCSSSTSTTSKPSSPRPGTATARRRARTPNDEEANAMTGTTSAAEQVASHSGHAPSGQHPTGSGLWVAPTAYSWSRRPRRKDGTDRPPGVTAGVWLDRRPAGAQGLSSCANSGTVSSYSGQSMTSRLWHQPV